MMEHLIYSSTRVLRGLDKAADLVTSFPELEIRTLSDPSSISAGERLQILDFPDPQTQEANITSSSTLDKKGLLKQAVESPDRLTQNEIQLLEDRYWLNISRRELRACTAAETALNANGIKLAVVKRLERVRMPLYDEYEAQAIENAGRERYERMMRELEQRTQRDIEASISRGQPWLRQLWEEDWGKKYWGYAVFENPQWAANSARREQYHLRRDEILSKAQTVVGCGSAFRMRWSLKHLPWPGSPGDEYSKQREGLPAAMLDTLRKNFKNIRSQSQEHGVLPDGILRNVFLYIDSDSVDSVMSPPAWVDDMWVWAIDPDYEAPATSDKYQGYLRVRLQQIVNNFFESRRFYADQFSVEDLWKAAQTKNSMFVSVKEEEAGLWEPGRDVGSCLRAQPIRLVSF